MEKTEWKDTVVLIDADYVDSVAFNLIVNFERILNRPIPKADLAHWLVCVALDGGVPEGENEIQVVLIHGKNKKEMENFAPSAYSEMDGQAFRDPYVGEFMMSALADESPTSTEALYVQAFETLVDAKEIKRLILAPDMASYGTNLQRILHEVKEKEVALLAMEPLNLRGIRTDILGYSLMSALGIRSDELK